MLAFFIRSSQETEVSNKTTGLDMSEISTISELSDVQVTVSENLSFAKTQDLFEKTENYVY